MAVWDKIPVIIFTDASGNQYLVKDIRPFSTYKTSEVLKITAGDTIDEIISRTKYYGKDTEGLSYALVDNNIEALMEVNFDLTQPQIKTLAIPIIND